MEETSHGTDSVPKVSIIVRTCNRPDLLKETLASIKNQTWQNIEIVLVNDGNQPVAHIVDDMGLSPIVRLLEHSSPQGRSKAANLAPDPDETKAGLRPYGQQFSIWIEINSGHFILSNFQSYAVC